MSLTKIRLFGIVKKQYRYKFKAYLQVFVTLTLLQAAAIVFSFGGTGMMGGGSMSFEIDTHFYSADLVVVFTILWGFITSVLITTKAYRLDDFSFVTNRLSSGLSNILFLLTASFIGGVTSMLSSYLIKSILYFFRGMTFISAEHVIAAPIEFLLGVLATTLYIFLFSALGYLIGTLVQLHRGFVVLVPAALIVGLLPSSNTEPNNIITFIYHFLFTESSLLLFITKVLVISAVSFICALAVANRMEVNP